MALISTGTNLYSFILREDLYTLPDSVRDRETYLHGGFVIDDRDGFGHIYYAMPGAGIMRIQPDLKSQTLIPLPDDLLDVNFHSTKIGDLNGKRRLFLTANDHERVVVVSLEGEVELMLSRPDFDVYMDSETPYKPTDLVLYNSQFIVADGYGANFISTAHPQSQNWLTFFGGFTDNPDEHGKFGTAHGMGIHPLSHDLVIADRLNSRLQVHSPEGEFISSHKLPEGTWPCGVHFVKLDGRWLAIVGCLYDDVNQLERPAPIYILDGESYEILSKIQPKVDLGVELAQRIHNVIGYSVNDTLYLICQSWNPGHYFVLQLLKY